MAFQIVGIGDWHQKSTSTRNAARMKALDQILQEGVQLPALAAWLQVGDVYDSRSTVEDRNTVAGSLVAMAQHAPVIVVGGNHCAPGDLDVLGKLASRWPIYVVTSPRVLSLTLATGQPAHVACLPYPHRASLVAAGVGRDELLDVGMQALQDTCSRLAAELTEKTAELGGIGLFAAHVNVEGSIASNGQPSIGKELSITTGACCGCSVTSRRSSGTFTCLSRSGPHTTSVRCPRATGARPNRSGM